MNQVDPKDLRIVIDEWQRTYHGGKYMGLLVRSKPDNDGKVKDWLIAMNDDFEKGTAENMRIWIKQQLEAIHLSIYGVTLLGADNEATNKRLAADMEVDFEGCNVHLVDLIGDDAWALLDGSWTNKVQYIINNYFNTPNMQDLLKKTQSERNILVQKLLAWNETRWLGKPLAVKRLIEVSKDNASARIIRYNLTAAETESMKDVMALMEILASLLSSFTHEKNIFPIMCLCNYGSHYRLIQQTYFSIVLHLANIDWDNRDPTEGERTWLFGKGLLEGLEKRFFTTVRKEVLIGYYLDKGDVRSFGFKSFPDLERLFLIQGRNAATVLPADEGARAGLLKFLPLLTAARILAQAPLAMQYNTPITTDNIISDLKLRFQSLYSKWYNDMASDEKIFQALQTYLDDHPATELATSQLLPSNLTQGAVSGALLLMRGSPSSNSLSEATTLRSDWDSFQHLSLPTGYHNSLQWACSSSTTGFYIIRHLIKKILSRPYTSVPAEQVFSVGRFQSSAYSSTLNSDDYETRVMLHYNRRNYTFEERARFYDISPYIFEHVQSKRVKNRYSEVMGIPMGATALRSTVKARDAKHAKHELQRSASAPPTPTAPKNTTDYKKSSSKKRSGSPSIVINSDNEDENFDETHRLNRSIQEKEARREAGRNEELKDRIVKHLKLLLQNNTMEEEVEPQELRMNFESLLHRTLSHVPNAAKLREIVPSIALNHITKFVTDLIKGLEEGGQAVEEAINLSLVGVDSLLENQSSSFMDMNIVDLSLPSSSVPPVTQPTRPTSLYQDMTNFQQGMSNLDAFLLATTRSWDHWKKENEQLAAELAEIERYLADRGCKLVNVPADGSCLYHVICLALLFHHVEDAPRHHLELRQQLVEYMKGKEEAWFELPSGMTKEEYIQRQSSVGRQVDDLEWGDINTIRAASLKYKKVFNVVSIGHDTRQVDGREGMPGRKPAPIELILVGYRHYMWGCPQNHVERIMEAAIITSS